LKGLLNFGWNSGRSFNKVIEALIIIVL
jgi:hypothetical protein